jgi:hypothetical protein
MYVIYTAHLLHAAQHSLELSELKLTHAVQEAKATAQA